MVIDSQVSNTELWNSLNSKFPEKSRRFPFKGKQNVEKALIELAPQFGVTRISDISGLSQFNFPVFQSCRPNLFAHTHYGLNTGSQGKGLNKKQALISCLMESLEAFSSEPRNALLIRSSYSHLSKIHRVANPNMFKWTSSPSQMISDEEPLVWTESISVTSGSKILIPAELVYFPFFSTDYGCKSHFPYNSNGLAANFDYSNAILNGIYEVIERHYRHKWIFEGSCKVVGVLPEKEWYHPYVKYLKNNTKFSLQLYCLKLGLKKEVPTILAVLFDDEVLVTGMASDLMPTRAAIRAANEAFQVLTTRSSGSREDMNDDFDCSATSADSLFVEALENLPRTATFRLTGRNSLFLRDNHKSLNRPIDVLSNWITSHFSADYFAVNLTRVGVPLPVVKIIVPGMRWSSDRFNLDRKSILDSIRYSYGVKK